MKKSNFNNSIPHEIVNDDFTQIRAEVCKLLDNNKSENILTMNLRPHFQYDLWFIVATALSQTHLKKLCTEVIVDLKKRGIYPAHTPNDLDYSSGWVALDYGELIVHIFTADKREFYDLEGLWINAKVEHFIEAAALRLKNEE